MDSEGRNGSSGRRGDGGSPELQSLHLAAAISMFQDRLRAGETPDPDELLGAHPGNRAELEAMLSLIYWGKAVLTDTRPAEGHVSPCSEGTIIGDYRIAREIGRGGMGIVYEAEQVSLRRSVALKVLPRVLGLDAAALRRFRREARVAASLHHTNIVPVYDFGQQHGVAYYSMEIIDGPSLDSVISELRRLGGPCATAAHLALLDGPMEGESSIGVERAKPSVGSSRSSRPPGAPAGPDSNRATALAYSRKVAWLLSGVAEGLHVAHQKGIVHGDVKPANLMLSAGGQLLITDFGVARIREGTAAATAGRFLGTLHYASPEQVEASRPPVDHRADIFSLGATLYELLTLDRPFRGRDGRQILERILHSEPASPRRANPWIAPDLEAIALRAMEKRPERRYETALDLSNDLRRFVLGESVVARRPGVVERLGRALRRHWRRLALVSLLLALIVAGVWSHLSARRRELLYRVERAERLIELAADLLRGDLASAVLPGGIRDVGSPPDQAIACLSEALDLKPDDGRAHFLRGNARFESGHLQEAVADYTRAIECGWEVAAARYRRGLALRSLGDEETARRELRAATGMVPEDGLLAFYRGVNAQSEGRLPRAIELFERAVRERPDLRPLAYYRLALCHYRRDESDRAVACLRVAIGLRPRWIAALSLLARIGLEKPEWELVDEAVGVLRSLPEGSDPARKLLARCLALRGEFSEAREVFARVSDGTEWESSHLAFQEKAAGGDTAGLEELIERHLRDSPACELGWIWLGALREHQQRSEDARDAYLKADAVGDGNSVALVRAALVSMRQDRLAEAATSLEKAARRKALAIGDAARLTVGRSHDGDEIPTFPASVAGSSPSLVPRLGRGGDLDPEVFLGEVYRRIGRLEESRRVLEGAARESPHSSVVHHELGATLLALDRVEDARRALMEATRLGSRRPHTYVLLASVCRDTGRLDEARETLEEARSRFPGSALPLGELARLELAARRFEAAVAVSGAGIETGELSWFFQYLQGRALKRLGNAESAEEAFGKTIDIAPKLALAHWELGDLSLARGAATDAERHFRGALRWENEPVPRESTDVDVFAITVDRRALRISLGLALLAQERVAEAREAFARAAGPGAHPSYVDAWIPMGYARLGRIEDGLIQAEAELPERAGDAVWRVCIGRLHLEAGDATKAVRHLRQAVALEPRYVDPHALLAKALEQNGELGAAELVLRKAADELPEQPKLRRTLAGILRAQGREREAIEIYRELLPRTEPKTEASLQKDLAWSLVTAPDRTAQELEEALRLAVSLAESAPRNADYLSTCGLALLRAGDARAARSYLIRAENIYGMEPEREGSVNRGENLLHLSLTHAALGNDREAQEAYESGRELAPESPFLPEVEHAIRGD